MAQPVLTVEHPIKVHIGELLVQALGVQHSLVNPQLDDGASTHSRRFWHECAVSALPQRPVVLSARRTVSGGHGPRIEYLAGCLELFEFAWLM